MGDAVPLLGYQYIDHGSVQSTWNPIRFVHCQFDVVWCSNLSGVVLQCWPIVALSFLAPAHWRLDGGIRWNPRSRNPFDVVSMNARVVDPKSGRAFELFPGYMSQWSDAPLMNQSFADQGAIVARP